MPEIANLSLLLAIIVCILTFIDCHSLTSMATKTGKPDHRNGRLSDLILFSPFIALFYTEHFWINLLWTLSIILAVTAVQWICYRKGWLDSPPEVIALAPGSYLLTIIVYFIFFHEGFVEGSAPEPEDVNTGVHSSWSTYWLPALYSAYFLLAAVPKKSDSIFLSLLFLIPAITILPFFTGHYFWFMLLGFLFLLFSVHRGFKHMESGSGGALSVVGGYFYMLAAFASVVIYAILY